MDGTVRLGKQLWQCSVEVGAVTLKKVLYLTPVGKRLLRRRPGMEVFVFLSLLFKVLCTINYGRE